MIHLEDFPNEIFLEIFKYFTLSDLFDSFVDLNYRINSLLQSIHGRSLILNKPEDVSHPKVLFFKRNIQHLQIRHPSKVDFRCFPNLRSLISLFPRDQQLIGLRPKNLPHLTHLTVGFLGIWDCEIILKLCQRIFSNKFHHLRYCSLWPPAFNDTCTTKATPTIVHIHLQEGTLDDLRIILNVCPNLKRLRILVSMFSKVPVEFIHHENIERLEVSFVRYDGMWFEKLDWLFASLFNVKHLVISLCLIQADLDRLARLLDQHLVQLTSLKCTIHATAIPIKFHLLKRYHSLFQQIQLGEIDDNETCHCEGFRLFIRGHQNK